MSKNVLSVALIIQVNQFDFCTIQFNSIQFDIAQFKSKCGTTWFSLSLFDLFSGCSGYVAFVELIGLNDLLDDIDIRFPLLTNQRHRKWVAAVKTS